MTKNYQCDLCDRVFKYEKNYFKHKSTHSNAINQNKDPVTTLKNQVEKPIDGSIHNCYYCNKSFKHKNNMYRHMKHQCKLKNIDEFKQQMIYKEKLLDQNLEKVQQLLDQNLEKTQQLIDQNIGKTQELFDRNLEKTLQLENLITQQASCPVTNNFLQVMCISANDNYLDILSGNLGFDQALEYVKNCALSDLNGDVKLIEKIYFEGRTRENALIVFIDKKRGKLSFVDENKQMITDLKGDKLSQTLGNNLQNTYLKGINHLITNVLETRQCPNRFLDEYDLQLWNKHIYDLTQFERKRQIIKRLMNKN